MSVLILGIASFSVSSPSSKEQPRLDCVVKLGGSALTSKAQFETLNADVLRRTAATIGKLARSPSGPALLIIHGAGSFGHQHAKHYSVGFGSSAHPQSAHGCALTRSAVTRLNALVVQALIEAGVPAVGISPFPSWRTSAGALSSDAMDGVERALHAGLVPVMHGDVVLDDEQGWAILSGDELMVVSAARLGPARAVFLMDVAGVYDRPPSEEGAVLIERIEVGADGRAQLPRTSTASHDVTGGLDRKLGSALRLASAGVRTYLVRAGSPSEEQAIAGDVPVEGTLVVRAAADAVLGTGPSS